MEVACTSMIHAATPHFLWPFAVRHVAHQLNLWPRVSLSETSPTLRWTGEVGDASRFRVWGSHAFVRDTNADKLSSRAIPCAFLGFPPVAPWLAVLPPHLAPCLPFSGRHVLLEALALEPLELVALELQTLVLESLDVETPELEVLELEPLEELELEAMELDPLGLEMLELEVLPLEALKLEALELETLELEPVSLTERREPASRPVSPVRTVRTARRVPRPRPPPVLGTHTMALRPSTAPQRVPLPSPPASSLPEIPHPEFDRVRAASPTVTHYAASLVAESESVCSPSVGGECALGTDVLEDKQEDFESFAAAVPHLVAWLLAPEGDPDALDIPTPRSYAEAITGPYSS
ncbi:unnamed protein product [Closterium sp. Yama58-4]|nr:unnamed protein product [Closterium sp. Yama58-4]